MRRAPPKHETGPALLRRSHRQFLLAMVRGAASLRNVCGRFCASGELLSVQRNPAYETQPIVRRVLRHCIESSSVSLTPDTSREAPMAMKKMRLGKAFTLIEPGPVVLVTTSDGRKDNVMTISWITVVDFTPRFAMTTGPWNASYAALRKSRECVLAIPTVDQIDEVVGIGTCSGSETDKFGKFGLTPLPARHVGPPLIEECLANIECRVVDIVKRHDIVVLEGLAAYFDGSRKERRTLHAVGDGSFIVDGRKLDRRRMMRLKLPAGV